ncbi:hypothetical protein [Streptomyces venezuelae]|uniref:hypothetical protein n=1 Tax=Streptomyces venezuelae TaxID=54571 RepID=UPI003657080D
MPSGSVDRCCRFGSPDVDVRLCGRGCRVGAGVVRADPALGAGCDDDIDACED